MGNGAVLNPGDIQYMSAGTGVLHSEFNPSPDHAMRLLQIWIQPDQRGYPPAYAQTRVDLGQLDPRPVEIAGKRNSQSRVQLRQDARMLLAGLSSGQKLDFEPEPDRRYYLHVIDGSIALDDDQQYSEGDALEFLGSQAPAVEGSTNARLLIFDLPA